MPASCALLDDMGIDRKDRRRKSQLQAMARRIDVGKCYSIRVGLYKPQGHPFECKSVKGKHGHAKMVENDVDNIQWPFLYPHKPEYT